jgi:hypothetical protein
MRKLQSHFPCRSNETKYDLVFLEALVYQCYYGLLRHVCSPPFIGVLALELFCTEDETVGSPTNPAVNPQLTHSYYNHMTLYKRLHNTVFVVDEVRAVGRH